MQAQGIALEYNESIAPAFGMSYGGRIALLPGQTKAEEFSVLVHEVAHERIHKSERRTATTKVVRETEAEAVAFVVSKARGAPIRGVLLPQGACFVPPDVLARRPPSNS